MASAHVILEVRVVAEGSESFVVVEALNQTNDAVTLVAHPRYVLLEVENEFGQYTRGVAGGSAKSELPKSSSYVTAAKQQRVSLLRLPLVLRPGDRAELLIGEETFLEPKNKPRIRATYKAADRTMPNLPRNSQKSFFPGPADGISEPVANYTA